MVSIGVADSIWSTQIARIMHAGVHDALHPHGVDQAAHGRSAQNEHAADHRGAHGAGDKVRRAAHPAQHAAPPAPLIAQSCRGI